MHISLTRVLKSGFSVLKFPKYKKGHYKKWATGDSFLQKKHERCFFCYHKLKFLPSLVIARLQKPHRAFQLVLILF